MSELETPRPLENDEWSAAPHECGSDVRYDTELGHDGNRNTS